MHLQCAHPPPPTGTLKKLRVSQDSWRVAVSTSAASEINRVTGAAVASCGGSCFGSDAKLP